MHNEQLLKVENEAGLYRDPASGAIINTNDNALNKYLAARKQRQEERAVLDQHTSEIAGMKRDLDDIKNMLHVLLQRT